MKLILVLTSAFMWIIASLPLLADAVITPDGTKFGRVVRFDSSSVVLKSGCSSGAETIIAWKRVLLLRFDSKCKPHVVQANPAGLERCDKPRIPAFIVEFQNSTEPIYALKVALKPDGNIQFVLMGDESMVTGKREKVKSIEPADICASKIPKKQKVPAALCWEAKQWAANWSPEPVFSNRVFTKGSSIYIEEVGRLRGLTHEDIRFAYQSALSIWAIALQDARATLPQEFQKYIDSSTASGGNFKLFTPPQVVRTRCPGSALAIVRWYAERENIFPIKKRNYVAMAQVQGRTVLLNANDNTFRVSPSAEDLSNNDVNLVTVFLHELGHSFGLSDRRRSDEYSVMDPVYVVDNLSRTLRPSRLDLQDFVDVLKASIEGSAPGVFNPAGCAGLRRTRSGRLMPRAYTSKFRVAGTRVNNRLMY
jgi:hypothetical protein